MLKPLILVTEKENERLEALKAYDLLDSEAESTFDSLTNLAAIACEVPICLISLVDKNRQWFKSAHGLSSRETPRDISFCGHAINQTEIFCIEDARADDRFKDNPLVTGDPNIVFYAGKPLIDVNGFALGTLCVIDTKPRSLSSKQMEQLSLLADQVVYLIHSRSVLKKKNEAYSLLAKLSENLPGFIYTYQLFPDGKSCFPFSSKLIEEIYEVTSEEVRRDASKVFTRIHPDDYQNVAHSINISAKEMTRWSCDYRVVLPTLGEKWVRGNANPEKSGDGSILWHGFISDITELKKQDEVINHTFKMASLGEMAAGIAHEINNPLTIIKGASQQIVSHLKKETFDKEKILKHAEKIDLTTERISKIVKGLKFFSNEKRVDQFKNETIMGIIEDTISLCSEKFKNNDVVFNLKCPINAGQLSVECHSVEISQVLINLLNNAYDAIEFFEEKWIELEIQDNSESVVISVTDCGHGIKPEDISKILTPFYSTKDVGKGTGLGLSISHKIIESHNGKFWVDSSCKNTKFVFEIPKFHDTPLYSIKNSA